MKRKFGLIGYPLGHSFSKRYFTDRFKRDGLTDCQYDLYPIPGIEELPALLLQHPELQGLNVTIPYKEAVLPYLHRLDPLAERTGAVNAIRIEPEGLTGFNTDVPGFQQALELFFQRCQRRTDAALILGSGGAAKAVATALEDFGIPHKIVSRNPGKDQLSYQQLHGENWLETHELLIQTTPLGMAPNVNACPEIPWKKINARHLAFDLVYNPGKTVFLAKFEAKGAQTENGLSMLYAQADAAWQIWNA
jgi:shikimate dehydrogenase